MKISYSCLAFLKFLTKTTIPDLYKVIIASVYLEVKRNATLEDIQRKYLKETFFVLNKLNISYKLSELTGISKLIIGGKEEVCEIYSLEESVFIDRSNKKNYSRYGELMGYPKCCIEKRVKEENLFVINKTGHYYRLNNPIGYHYYINNPWPQELSNFFIRHLPCSPNCKESIKIGSYNRFLSKFFYGKILKILEKENNLHYLSFAENLWIRFLGEEKENVFKINKIMARMESEHREHTDLNLNLTKQKKFQKKIKNNYSIKVTEKIIKIYKNSRIYQYTKKDESDGCLIHFIKKIKN